jgi:A/G-specific adenine glycosylase
MRIMQERLLAWFRANKRSFNFRNNRNAYRVWVAEVMLQQTRAQVVEAYFERFMNKWPTLESLAKAREAEVIKMFEGLGYYSRPRRLLAGSKQIIDDFEGQIPQTREELLTIAGIGPYTAGAILAFAFKKGEVAMDGNVMRVMARLTGLQEVIKGKKVLQKIEAATKQMIEHKDAAECMEALIELGATNCNKRADCTACPLNSACVAYKHNLFDIIPLMPERKKIQKIYRCVALVEFEGKFAIQEVAQGKIMASLSEFYYVEHKSLFECTVEQNYFEKKLKCSLDLIAIYKQESHSFTHYKAILVPKHFRAKTRPHAPLKTLSQIQKLALSSGHKRILKNLLASMGLVD